VQIKMKSKKVFLHIFQAFFEHDCLNLAASLSFYAILSLIPLSIIMLSVAGFLFGSYEGLVEKLAQDFVHMVPLSYPDLLQNINTLLANKSSFGILGIFFLLFTATILFTNLEKVMNKIFQTTRSRNIFQSHMLGILIIFLISILFFAPSMLQLLAGLFGGYAVPFALRDFFNAKVFFILSTFIAYLLAVHIIPTRKVALRYSAFGALVFSFGLLGAKLFFRWYMYFALERYNFVYGSLSALVLSILWIYYLAVVTLFALEVTAVLQSQKMFHFPVKQGDEK